MVTKPSGYEVPPDIFGRGGYSTTDPGAIFKPRAKPIYPSGGGGTTSPSPTPTPTGPSQAELDKRAAEIEKNRTTELFKANQAYQQGLRSARSLDDRRKLLDTLQKNIATIQANARLQRVERGIVDSTTISTATGDIIATQKNLADIKNKLGFEGDKVTTPDKTITSAFIGSGGEIRPYVPGDLDNPILTISDKIKRTISDISRLPSSISSSYRESATNIEKELAEMGRFVPTNKEQLKGGGRKETLEFQPEFLTDKELEQLSFGGLDTLIKRQQKQLDFDTRVAIDTATNQEMKVLDEEIRRLNDEYKAGNLSQTQLGNKLSDAENRYKTAIESRVGNKIDLNFASVSNYIDSVAKKQRVLRALELAPAVFTESYLAGLGFGAGVRGVSAGARALGITKEATRLGLSIGALGFAATQLPKIAPFIQDFKSNPTAVILEITPVLTGFALGSNPNLVKDIKNLGNEFVESQKKLLADTRAKTGGRTKQRQVQESKKKVEVSKKDLKDRLKKATQEDIKKFVESETYKNWDVETKRRFAALTVEAKTGVTIIDENGNILTGQLREALNKVRSISKPAPEVLKSFDKFSPKITSASIEPKTIIPPRSKVKIKPPFSGLGQENRFASTIPGGRIKPFTDTGRFGSMGTFEGRIKSGTLGTGTATLTKQRLNNLDKDLIKIQSKLRGNISSIEKTSLLNRQRILNEQKSKLKTQLSEQQKSQQLSKQRSSQISRTSLLSSTLQKSAQKSIQKSKLRLATPSELARRSGRGREIPRPRPIIGIPDLGSSFSSKKKSLRRITTRPKSSVAYYAEVKERGKWKRIINKPLVRKQAIALAQYTTDRTIGASARIKPTMKYKKLAKVSVRSSPSKFRDYEIRKGKRIATPNKWIEKRKYRLDTPNEKQTIQQFRKTAAFRKLLVRSK